MSSHIKISIRPMEEWHQEARQLAISSSNELVPMMNRMVELLRVIKDPQANKDALQIALRELEYEQAKSYIRDTDRFDEFHYLFYGLSQCFIEVYSTIHDLTTISQSEFVPPPIPYIDGNLGAIESTSKSIKREDIFDSTGGSSDNSTHSCPKSGSENVSDQFISDQNIFMEISLGAISDHDAIEDYTLSLNVSMKNEMIDSMEESHDDDDIYLTEPLVSQEIDENEKMESNLDCPICTREYNDLFSLSKHLGAVHKTTIKKLDGRLVCKCGQTFGNTETCLNHIKSNKCLKSTFRTLYDRKKVQKAIAEAKKRGIKMRKSVRTAFEVDRTRNRKRVNMSKCFLCQKAVNNGRFAYESHLSSEHRTTMAKEYLWYECEKCGQSIHSTASYQRHFKTCHRPREIILWQYDSKSIKSEKR